MMKGMWFDDIHSYQDLNLVLSKVNIPPAAVKTNFLNIPGADGSADLTEALGEVKFKDRTCTFTFTAFPQDDFEEKKQEISNLLNGKRCKIRLDKDPNYYWIGRCSINSYASNKSLHQIVVGATVAPYKYKVDETNVAVRFCGKNLFDISKVTDTSELTNNGDGTLTVGANKYNVSTMKKLKVLCPSLRVGDVVTLSFTTTATESHYIYLAGYNRTIHHGQSYIITDVMLESLVSFYGAKATDPTYGQPTTISDVQIELGRVVTTFEPYASTTQEDVTLTNGRKSVVPSIVCTAETTISFDGVETTLNAGTHTVLNLQLKEGSKTVSLVGSGVVSFIYQEGDL